ncbi:MAG: GNAT family N-acetyltransferase [Phycisphaerae bacterium]
MHTADVQVRPATIHDAATVVAFNIALARESEGLTLDPDVVTAGVRTALSDLGRCRYFLACTPDAVAGQIMFTTEWSDWRNAWIWWIQSVYVDTPFRRRGVYSALHQHVRALARDEPDVCALRLYVDRENHAAINTYTHVGMVCSRYLIYEQT